MSLLERIFDGLRHRSTPGDRSGPSEQPARELPATGRGLQPGPPNERETYTHRLLRLKRKAHRKHMRRKQHGQASRFTR